MACTAILILSLHFTANAQKLEYGVSTSYGIQRMEWGYVETKYNPNLSSTNRIWDYMGLKFSEGGKYQLGGFIQYSPVKLAGLRSGLNLWRVDGGFTPAITDQEEIQFANYYAGIPVELVLFPKSRFQLLAGLSGNLRLYSNKKITDMLSFWEDTFYSSEGYQMDLHLNRFDFQYTLGLGIKIWKANLAVNYFKSFNPFLTTQELTSQYSDYDGLYDGKLDFYYSGVEAKLSVPIGTIDLKNDNHE